MKKIILILASVFMLTSCIYEDYNHYPPSRGRPPYNNGNKRPIGNGGPPKPGNPNNGRPNHGRPNPNNGRPNHNNRH